MPEGFLWGASTASFQVEGAAQADGRGESIWDRFCRTSGRVRNGDTGDVACDHFHRYPEDVALMRDLGLGAYRFSIAWPRVLPGGKGAVNSAGLGFYDRLIDTLLAAGIEPWPCLYHWDLPQHLHELGGWSNRDCAGWFADYATIIARRLGDRVPRLATFNEPGVFTLLGYGFGNHAPGIADRAIYLSVIHHVNLAHGMAIDVWRSHAPKVLLGAIHCQQPGRPERDTPADRWAAQQYDIYWNRSFPDPQILGHYPEGLAEAIEPCVKAGDLARICQPIDWFGMNHYSPAYLKSDARAPFGAGWGAAPADLARTGIGWPIDPQGFGAMLCEVTRRYRLPIYVMENGAGYEEVPDADGRIRDTGRIRYFEGYIGALRTAIAAGADVRGYFVWSLLDNFEWADGYSTRFGIVHVDYESLRRTPKDSFTWLQQTIARDRSPRPRSKL